MTETTHNDIAVIEQSARPLTRRAALWGALASSAALTLPAVAYAASEASPAVTTMSELIEAHRAAAAEYHKACMIYDQVDAAAGDGPSPRVQVGNLVTWDENNQKVREPIWAYDDESIIAHAKSRQMPWDRPPGMFTAPQQEWVDGKLAELAATSRAYAEFKERTGLKAAEDLTTKHWEADLAARLALIAHRPANAGEAAAKVAYMAEDYSFSPNCISGNVDQIERLFALLGEVQS